MSATGASYASDACGPVRYMYSYSYEYDSLTIVSAGDGLEKSLTRAGRPGCSRLQLRMGMLVAPATVPVLAAMNTYTPQYAV